MAKRALDRVYIFDTTLRDGEQTPGVSLSPDEKMEIAKQLDKLGVDTIEAGFPITSEGEVEAVRMIANAGLNAEVCGLARCEKSDIDTALSCDVPLIHLFIATSDIHLQHKLKISRAEALKKAIWSVEYAKSHGVIVEFSAEDATRSDRAFMTKVYTEACAAGADRINVPDTVGVTTPRKMGEIITDLKKSINVPISVHCHDDFGLAVANTLAGIEAGAVRAHVAINGIGERAGNASLEEVAMSVQCLFGKKTGINTPLIYDTSRMISRLTGVVVQPNKAIVGANAFAHEAGIHQDGMLKHQSTYEIMLPETVGLSQSKLVLGKHSGRHAFRVHLEEMGYELDKESINQAFRRFKDLADKKKVVTDADIEALIADEFYRPEPIYQMLDLQVTCGTVGMPTATVRLLGPDGDEHVYAAMG
ncbi:MAG: 2-isopropylmalate synthase, partial [Thaumarchaeota archaeon]|nr:2-isopropylmalate synthase [Nitrososphaerota archaeon]